MNEKKVKNENEKKNAEKNFSDYIWTYAFYHLLKLGAGIIFVLLWNYLKAYWNLSS